PAGLTTAEDARCAADGLPQEALSDGLPQGTLPVGLLFDRGTLEELRRNMRHGETRRLFGEMRAEAEANLDYRPESYLGTYMPVDWGRQGIERASSPNREARKLFSTLVYSAFVYAAGGGLR